MRWRMWMDWRAAILNEPFVLVAPTARADEFARMDLRLAQAAPFIRQPLAFRRHDRRAICAAPT